MSSGHDWSADHWSFGILVYEMVTGTLNNRLLGRFSRILLIRLTPSFSTGLNPFFYEGMDQMTLYHSIVEDDFMEPKGAGDAVTDLISKLLEKDPVQRIGSWARGELDILEHPWFAELDLSEIRAKQVEAPWVPPLKDPLDTSCFDDWDHLVDKMVEGSPDLPPSDQELFAEF